MSIKPEQLTTLYKVEIWYEENCTGIAMVRKIEMETNKAVRSKGAGDRAYNCFALPNLANKASDLLFESVKVSGERHRTGKDVKVDGPFNKEEKEEYERKLCHHITVPMEMDLLKLSGLVAFLTANSKEQHTEISNDIFQKLSSFRLYDETEDKMTVRDNTKRGLAYLTNKFLSILTELLEKAEQRYQLALQNKERED